MRHFFSLCYRLVLVTLLFLFVLAVGFRTAAHLRENSNIRTAVNSGKYVNVEELEIHYRNWGSITGKPVLLIHGAMAWADTWHEIATLLADNGYYVVAPDLPPFGFSERPANQDYSRKAQANRILRFADALALDSFFLVGHSFGGGATLETALTVPQRIHGLALLDVALGLEQKTQSSVQSLLSIGPIRNLLTSLTFTNPLLTGKGLRDFVFDDSIVTPERVVVYQSPLSIKGTTPAVGYWLLSGLFADEQDSLSANTQALKQFKRPTLIIWGREDTVTPLDQGQHIHELMPESRLEILDQVNHIPHIESPNQVARLLSVFMNAP
jgi:pimeloyl-ACP methyl ester carboxylesterase